jgi:hypothetical protein
MSEPEELMLEMDDCSMLITDYASRFGDHIRRFSVEIFFPLGHPLFGRDHQYMPDLHQYQYMSGILRGEWKSSGDWCGNTWRVSFDVEYPIHEPVSFAKVETLVYYLLFN